MGLKEEEKDEEQPDTGRHAGHSDRRWRMKSENRAKSAWRWPVRPLKRAPASAVGQVAVPWVNPAFCMHASALRSAV